MKQVVEIVALGLSLLTLAAEDARADNADRARAGQQERAECNHQWLCIVVAGLRQIAVRGERSCRIGVYRL